VRKGTINSRLIFFQEGGTELILFVQACIFALTEEGAVRKCFNPCFEPAIPIYQMQIISE